MVVHTADRPADIVVFDLGGVLVQIVRSWREAHERAGLPPHSVLEDPVFDRERTRLAAAHQIGAVTPEAYCSAIAAASQGGYTPEQAFAVLLAWHWGEYPGVDRVVDAIDLSGVPTGALSNTNAAHWRDLREDPTDERFPTVRRLEHAYASHLLGLAKPDPAVFRVFESKVRCSPARIVFFDDSEENVAAARAAGWRAEWIDYRGDTAEQMYEHLRRMSVLE